MRPLVLAAVLAALYAAPPASAQASKQSFLGLQYSTGLPLGDTADWTSGFSFRGVGLDYRKFRSRNSSLGLSASWNVFSEQVFETAKRPEVPGHITGNQSRYVNAIPLMLNAHRYYGEGGRRATRFYSGVGLGAIANKRRVEIGVFAEDQNQWHFGVNAEVGVIAPMNWDNSFFGSVKYYYGFSSNDLKISYLTFNLGIAAW